MTTKKVKIYICGWRCSCGQINDEDKDNCQKCEKEFSDSMEFIEDYMTFEFPAHWEICPDCQGNGTTYLGLTAKDQPAFTSEDFYDEGPDFYEDYMEGRYDKMCPECGGSGKVKVVKEDAIKDNLSWAYSQYVEELRCQAETDAIYEMERRMGA